MPARSELETKQTASEVVRITPAAAAEMRRLAESNPCVLEVRVVRANPGYRNKLDLVPPGTPCVGYCVSAGIRVQFPDELTVTLIQGTEIDYVSSNGRMGFAIRNPNVERYI